MVRRGLGRLVASPQDTAAHEDSNPGDLHSSTSKQGQREAGSASGGQAAHRLAEA